jgi:uncharacterized protein (TIGR02594 family)
MSKYKFLENIPDLPRIIKIGLDNLGIKEVAGTGNNATILSWAEELGIKNTYSNDSIPWCGLFVAMVVKRSGREPVVNPLWARNWANWGIKTPKAMLGDVLVFVRKGGGHVGFYVAEDKDCYHVLGGNQSDAVTITRIQKSRCIAIRRPAYNNQPSSAKEYIVAADGNVSTNEA